MRSRASFLTATLVLAICLIGQAAEIADQWDHTLQTGNDTEYTFVVLALCAGAAYSLKWFVPPITLQHSGETVVFHPRLRSVFPASLDSALSIFIPASPPSAELRL